ncbi:filamentous hemagglutinin N-terminal domain-containing protein [Amylibacter sp. SFDW26]|uniref:two-partner secretion domain-containing protein n=1 Tax=Amylibacter sp. SFDW26 TaxID=2652722 RepID=UPI001261C007|nr:DUF637 domain-containing protein [Amylibacter sp. SFDW26]KAB7613724.1 filamentous hemagglutinin N-terminal domain-containing protein [Amylibacter sp. SFDW26]
MTFKAHTQNKKRSKSYATGLYVQPTGLAKILRNTTGGIMCFLMAAEPLLAQAAQIQADTTAPIHAPNVYQAGNGVTTVDIVAPNASGLSHNQYETFNVDQNGVILNNSTSPLSQSQLGGLLEGNSNLSGTGSASVILNEVTGAGRSALEGALEVHGRAADVVIANVNGITCNGCGFINTPRVSLSTGRVELNARGGLSGFQVDGGDVQIGENGANLKSSQIFDIVSRKIKIDGPVAAGGDLNLIAGRNAYDYKSGTATSLGPDGDEPSIAIDSSLLGGMYAGRIKILSTDAGSGVNMRGQMASNTGEMSLTADGRLVLGKVQSKGTIKAKSQNGTIEVKRTLFSDQAVTLQGLSAVDISDNALVASKGDVTIESANISIGPDAIVAAGVQQDGTQTSAGVLTLHADQSIAASDSQLAAGKHVDLAASQIDISHSDTTNAETLRSLGSITIEADTVMARKARIKSGGVIHVKSDNDVSITGGDFASVQGVRIEAENISNSGSFETQADIILRGNSGEVVTSGRLAAATGLKVTAETAATNSGALISERNLEITTQNAFRNTDAGVIVSGANLTLDTGSISNSGELGAQGGDLTLTTAESLTNGGKILSTGVTTLTLPGAVNNTQNGLINGGTGLVVSANTLNNAGRIGSANGALDAEIQGNISNTGLLYSGTSSAYKLDGSFDNIDADILAEDNIIITGLMNDRSGALLNSSGTIEAVNGDIDLNVASLNNQRTNLVVSENVSSEVSQSGNVTTTVETRTQTLQDSTPAAQILAGGSVDINTDSVRNSHSQISANENVSINAGTVTNEGTDLTETVVTTTDTLNSVRYCRRRIFGFCISRGTRYFTTTTQDTESSTKGAVFGTIEAGKSLTANVEGYLNNNAVRSGVAQIGLSSGDRALNGASESSSTQTNALREQENLIVTIEGLLNRSAIFDTPSDPEAPFLIETRPEFIQPGQFLGSDYFLDRVGGYGPDITLRRFGDAYIEGRLIREQLFALTGHRNITAGASDYEQMKTLYNNAIDEQANLNLTFGTALTPSQIAGLSSDIIWLETQTVRGEQVLVPRVYLSGATRANVDVAGGQIRAGTTDIQTASLFNSGAISGENGLNIKATDAILNQGGRLFSAADITIDSGAIFANTSGEVVANGNVQIAAGLIINDTAKIRDTTPSGISDRIQQIGRIEAGKNVQIDASETVTSTGGEFVSGETTTITAGQNIEIGSLVLENARKDTFDGGYDSSYDLMNRLSSLKAGKDLNISAGQDLILQGVRAKAKEDAALDAKGEIIISSVQDQHQSDLNLKIETGGLFGTKTEIRKQEQSTETVKSVVLSGNDIIATSAEKDITVKASRLESDGETVLSAEEGKVALLTETDSSFTQDYIREEDLFWWNEADKGERRETIETVEIISGGGLRINAGNGIIVEYEAHENLNDAIAELSQVPSLAWVADLKTNPNVDWRAVEATVEEWDYESQGLTQAGALLITAITTFATGGFGVGGAGGLVNGIASNIAGGLGIAAENVALNAAINAGVTTLVNQSAVALVNNQGNLGDALQQLGSSESLRSLLTSIVSAGFTAGLTDVVGLGDFNPKTATALQNATYKLQSGLLHASVNATVDTAINGGNLGDNLVKGWSTAAITAGLAGVQQQIGDFGVANGIPEGAFPKILSHAVAGGLASELAGGSFADGALAGGLAEATGPLVGASGLQPEAQIRLQRLIGTAAVLLRGGDVEGAGLAGGFAASAHENNYLNHEQLIEAKEAQDELFRCRNGFFAGCSDEKIAALAAQVDAYKALSVTQSARLLAACESGAASCADMVRDATEFVQEVSRDRILGMSGGLGISKPGADQFYVSAGDQFNLETPVNLDALAVRNYQKALDGEISFDEATANIKASALNHESGTKLFVGGVQVVGGLAALAACPETGGLTCAALVGLAGANTVIGGNIASEGIAQLLSGEDERTLIEDTLINELGYSPEIAAEYVHNAELLVGIADFGAGGVLLLKNAVGKTAQVPIRNGNLENLNSVTNRTLDDILPNGDIPTSRSEFDEWVSSLSVDDIGKIWKDPDLKSDFKDMIRPGGRHEWCMCDHYDQFAAWGLSVDDVRSLSTATGDLRWTVPNDVAKIGGQTGGHISSPINAPFTGSTTFHNELSELISNSPDMNSFWGSLPAFAERWSIDPSLLPRRPN